MKFLSWLLDFLGVRRNATLGGVAGHAVQLGEKTQPTDSHEFMERVRERGEWLCDPARIETDFTGSTLGLTPKASALWVALYTFCLEDGLGLHITEGFRSPERQLELYARGRVKLPDGTWKVANREQVVTDALPGQSSHQSRMAFDVALNGKDDNFNEAKLSRCGEIGEALGLIWGGRFRLGGAQGYHDIVCANSGTKMTLPNGNDTDHFQVRR